MEKATLEIGKINKTMVLKFGLIVKPDKDKMDKFNHLLVEAKFNINGNEYYKFKPNPFITIDITKGGEKGDGWNSNQTVNLNRFKLFEFLKKLKVLLENFKKRKDLFYYSDKDNSLEVDRRVSTEILLDMQTTNKHIRMIPCVVESDDINPVFYEGCIFAINTLDNFCYLTYEEMEYLYYELSHVNMNLLSISLMQLIKIGEEKNSIEEIPLKPKTTKRETKKESIDSSILVHLNEKTEMDDIL